MQTVRASHRRHDRKAFFKYMSASTAKKVLKGQSLRWSSPLLFNDPFDVPRELAHGITVSQLREATARSFAELLKNPPNEIKDLDPRIVTILKMANRANSAEFTEQIVAAIFDESQNVSATRNESTALDDLQNMWSQWLSEFRILCLCASHEKTSMWYHYAEKYTGVVIELVCSDELSSPWLLAEPVNYPATPPDIFLPSGWGQILTLRKEIAVERLVHAYSYNKTPDWGYEEEWRIVSFKRDGELDQFGDYPVDPRNFSKIFLGPHISETDRIDVLNLLEGDLRHVLPFKSKIELDRRFSFSSIDRPFDSNHARTRHY